MQRSIGKPIQDQVPVAWLIRALLAGGVSLDAIVKREGIDTRALGRPDLSMRVRDFQSLFEWAAEAIGDPILGAHIAEHVTVADFQTLGYLLVNSPTIGEWLRNFERYHGIFAQDSQVRLSTRGKVLCVEYSPDIVSDIEPRQDVLFSVAVLIVNIRRHVRPGWVPATCHFTMPPPRDIDDLERILGTRPLFDQKTNGFTILARDLDIPIAGADATLLGILRQQAELIIRSHEDEDIVHRARLIIAANIADSEFGAEDAARMLNISVRTLHRELDASGTGYRPIRESVVHQLAREALLDPKTSVTSLAFRLGYSETSAFTRAFTRIEGMSPKAFRTTRGLTDDREPAFDHRTLVNAEEIEVGPGLPRQVK